MPEINLRQIHLFILRYRKILVAIGFSFIVWNISQTPPNGNLVLVANQFIPANTPLTSELFSKVTINDFDTESYVADISQIQSSYAKNDIPVGALINRDAIESEYSLNDRVDVYITLENIGGIPAGRHLHLWAQSDGYSNLVSKDAIVRTSETDNYGTRLTVSVPNADEYSVMQSQSIKVVLVN